MSSPVPQVGHPPIAVGFDRSSTEVAHARACQLFEDCHGSVYRYVRSFGLAVGESEDLVQDVALALLRHVTRHPANDNLKGWIFRVAHNLALKHRAREQRRARVARLGALVRSPIDRAPSVEDRLVAQARRGKLHAVLRALPERDRRCVVLRAEGLRYREIATTLGMSVGGVAKSLARALLRLQRVDERRSITSTRP